MVPNSLRKLSDENEWSCVYTGLFTDKVYTVSESKCDYYITDINENTTNSFIITNTFDPDFVPPTPPVDPDPIDPIDPVDPVSPVYPIEPTPPTDPIDPVEPVKPNPSDPSVDLLDPDVPTTVIHPNHDLPATGTSMSYTLILLLFISSLLGMIVGAIYILKD